MVNATNPELPKTVARLATPRPVQRFGADGNRLYVLEGEFDLTLTDCHCGTPPEQGCLLSCWGSQNVGAAAAQDLVSYTISRRDKMDPTVEYPAASPANPVQVASVLLSRGYVDDMAPFKSQVLLFSHSQANEMGPPNPAAVLRVVGQKQGAAGAPQTPGSPIATIALDGTQRENFGMALSGRHLFVADGLYVDHSWTPRIEAYYLVDDTTAVKVGESDGSAAGPIGDLQIVGNYLYAWAAQAFEVYDAAPPLATTAAGAAMPNMPLVASWATGRVKGGIVAGAYAYLIQDESVTMLDVTDPQLLRQAFVIDDEAVDLQVERGYLYVTTRQNGLRIYELARPSAFRAGPHYQFEGDPIDAARGENFVCSRNPVATGSEIGVLRRWPITTSEAGTQSHEVVLGGELFGGEMFTFGDDELWVDRGMSDSDCGLGNDSCLRVFDTSYFEAGALLARDVLLLNPYPNSPDGIACTSNDECCAYQECATWEGAGPYTCRGRPMYIKKLVRGASTEYFALIRGDRWGGAFDTWAGRGGPEAGIYVFSMTAPDTAPTFITRRAAGAGASCDYLDPSLQRISDILWTRGVLYTAGKWLTAVQAVNHDSPGFLDWGNTTDPTRFFQSDPDTDLMCARLLAAAGDYLYVLGEDLGDPDARCDGVTQMNASEPLLFTSKYIWIYDIKNPMHPQRISQLRLGDWEDANSVAIHGNLLLLGEYWEERVVMVDVANRASPEIYGAFSVPGINNAIDVYGSDVFSYGFSTGIHVIDGR